MPSGNSFSNFDETGSVERICRRVTLLKNATYLLQSGFDFCKYCARTNPTWRTEMAAKKKAKTKAKAKAKPKKAAKKK